MTFIKINTQKNDAANMQFMLKMLILLLLALVTIGINIYLYKMSHVPDNALSGIITAQAKQLLASYL
ncbi:hypothetical protein C7N43_21955 [Sphingobacteriales bacterium UPWRP_1]|nr:hypothetical protein B6N25_07095 [Sphingobacteriales bacterium TSM_CSS]PSJ74842.1 hypothetical protein C7N43_21955 [Sphingobacteriales bacterium UPWRP_1]